MCMCVCVCLCMCVGKTAIDMMDMAMCTELVITCVTSCVSFVWIVFLVKKRLDRFNNRSFGSF